MNDFSHGVAVGAAVVGLLVLAFAGGVLLDDSAPGEMSTAKVLGENSGIDISPTSEPPAEAVFYEAGTENVALVVINEMPPEYQSQKYGLWAGCNLIREFDTPGQYEVSIQEDVNVKLVRLGDYRLYGYHDFSPNQSDKCPPSEASTDA